MRSGPNGSGAARYGAAAWLGAALLACSASAGGAPPSTFATIVGNAILCLNQIDNAYFYAYLSDAFGPAYKREGGAYWFKSDATTLWGAKITDVIVSDDTSALTFLGLVADTTPEKLEEAVVAASGQHYVKKDGTAFPVRETSPGSRIIYFNTRSKAYCAKYKSLPPPIR